MTSSAGAAIQATTARASTINNFIFANSWKGFGSFVGESLSQSDATIMRESSFIPARKNFYKFDVEFFGSHIIVVYINGRLPEVLGVYVM